MYVIPELRLNVFQPASILSPRDAFKRFGMALGISYTGDQVAPMPISKIDGISGCASFNDRKLLEELKSAAEHSAASSVVEQMSKVQTVEPAAPNPATD